MKKITFSIILVNHNEADILPSLNNIMAQNLCLDTLEIIILTKRLEQSIKKQIKEIPLNIIIKESKQFNIIKMYNDTLKMIRGTLVHFSNTSIRYEDPETLNKVFEHINKEIICTKMIEVNPITKKEKKYLLANIKDEEINLKKNPQFNLSLESYFIKSSILKNIKFLEKFGEEAKEKFIVDLYQKKNTYFNLGSITLLSNKVLEDDKSNHFQYHHEWYDKSIINWTAYLKSLKKVPMYLQEIIIYKLYIKFKYNMNSDSKYESDELFSHIKELLKYIESEVFLNKYDTPYIIERPLAQFFYHLQGKTVVPIDLEKELINIYAINYEQGSLVFDCSVNLGDYIDTSDFNILIKYCEETIPIKRTKIFSETKAFNKVINEKYMFQFSIDITDKGVLKPTFIYKDQEYPLKFNFLKAQSRLDNDPTSFWAYKDFVVLNGSYELKIEKKHRLNILKYEFKYVMNKYRTENNKKRVLVLSGLRILYYLTKPIYQHKHLWITYDKLYKGGDNGEYLCQYGLKNNMNIYYIIKEDSQDYERLIKETNNKVLIFNSLKAKLYCLHAEAILKTHASMMGFCGFDGLAHFMVRGLLNAHVIEIQHGLTIQDIPEYQNRLADNIRLYLIASPLEKKNIMQEKYGFLEEQIKYTGLARYDGLKSNDQRVILITPTWRHNLAASSVAHGVQRGYNESFKESDYYKIYNALINDVHLIEEAKKYNYRIVYLIHPTLASQIDDFDHNDYVDIIPANGDMSYEKILREASLMVTDYSGVQYDFAYMRKPLVYFHPKELPPHYNNGSIDYKKDGFGLITENLDELITVLCESMKNNCQNKEEYIARANKFFVYDDYNNAKRIVESVLDFLEEQK